jgi:hypothetical protein
VSICLTNSIILGLEDSASVARASEISHTLLTFLQPQPHNFDNIVIVIPRVSVAKIKAPKVDNYYAMVVGPQ